MAVVEVEKKGAVAYVTLNRPDRLNALDLEMSESLYNAFYELTEDKDLRIIVVRGAGRAFCAGGDLGAFIKFKDMSRSIYQILDWLNQVVLMIRRCDKVVVASVHGAVSGAGFGFMGCCDVAIAAEGTRFNLAYVKIGACPDMFSSVILSRTVGLKRASFYALTGDFFSAQEAKEMGLVNFVVPDESLEKETEKLADRMAKLAPLAVKRIKELINAELFWDLEVLLEKEKLGICSLAKTEDMEEGIRAFFEKREPNYRGR